jgi:multidrug efflux system outer membrane protein
LNNWWTQGSDVALTRLIEAAENNSPSLDAALSRIGSARATVKSSQAPFFPQLNASGSVTHGNNASVIDQTGNPLLSTITSESADATWELDLFGGKRRSLEAARAQERSAQESWNDARISLAAEVANVYVSARQYQLLVERYRQEVRSRTATEELTSGKIREGLLPRTAAFSTEASTAIAASTLALQRGLFAQAINRLVMLTTLPREEVGRILGTEGDLPALQGDFDLQIPARILSQRPDVRASEYQLAVASANIGVAKANALPSLRLIGNLGFNTIRVSGFETTLNTWAFGPSLEIPVFSGGAYSARIAGARSNYDQAAANYRGTVLAAVRDVEDALARIAAVAERRSAAERAARNYHAYFQATEASYREGRSSLLEFEDARRQNLSSEETLLSVRVEGVQSWIALYKAVGGGWGSESVGPIGQKL